MLRSDELGTEIFSALAWMEPRRLNWPRFALDSEKSKSYLNLSALRFPDREIKEPVLCFIFMFAV